MGRGLTGLSGLPNSAHCCPCGRNSTRCVCRGGGGGGGGGEGGREGGREEDNVW